MSRETSFCPRFHHAVELIGRRWTGALIRALMDGPCRYAELRQAIPDLTDRMLSERLRELEAEGVVSRRVVPETPVRVEYELTDKGRALQASIAAISDWAQEWVAPPDAGAQLDRRGLTRGARARREAKARRGAKAPRYVPKVTGPATPAAPLSARGRK